MKRLLKGLLVVVTGLVGILVLAALAGFLVSERRINKTYDIAVAPIEIPTDAASIEEGRRLSNIRACSECHGRDFGGQVLLDDPMLGTLYTANLTAGEGSATRDFMVEDWVRAIRHGVGPEGRGLKVMPSNEFAVLSDEQLGQLIAYITSVPPVDRVWPESEVGPLGRALLLAGQLPILLPVEGIDHTVAAPGRIEPVASVEYGAYLITTCTGCHRPNLAGGPIPGAVPGEPQPANLTPAGNLANWTYEEFANTLRTGITPDGKVLDASVMPWPMALELTDIELEAIWLYLSSLPPTFPDA